MIRNMAGFMHRFENIRSIIIVSPITAPLDAQRELQQSGYVSMECVMPIAQPIRIFRTI